MSVDETLADDGEQREAYTRAMGLGIAAAIVTIPLALLARSASPDPVNVPVLSSDSRLYYLLALVVSVTLGAFAHYTDHDAGWARHGALGSGYRWIADQGRATAWIMPALTLGTVFLLLAMYHSWPVVLVAPLLAGSGVFVGVLARHSAFDPDPVSRRSARLALLANAYITAFVLLSVVYEFRTRSLLAAPAVALIVAPTIMVATDALDAPLRQRIILAVAGGLVMAEATWALNYWNAPGWYGGLVLSTLSFAIVSAISAWVEERLNPALVARLSGLAVAVAAVVAFIADQPV